MPAHHRKLILISIGAVNPSEFTRLRRLPRFNALCARGTLVTGVEPVFVTHPYPCLTSAVTGVYPNKHGVFDDARPSRSENGLSSRWHTRHVLSPTLFSEAAREGRSVASLLWPATEGLRSALCIPDYFTEPEGRLNTVIHSESRAFQFRTLIKARKLPSGPAYDDELAAAAALDAIHTKEPDLLAVSLREFERAKALYGAESMEARDALERCDCRAGLILDAAREKSGPHSTDIIVIGGCASLPVRQCVDLTEFLGDLSRDVVLRQSGGFACVRLSNPKDEDLQRRAAYMVKSILDNPASGVYRLLTPEEMAVSGLDTEFELGLEAAPGYSLGGGTPVRAQHGYTLERNDYQTFYLAAGASVPEDLCLTGGCVTDICPLAVRLLDLSPWDMDGELRIPLGNT